MWLGGQAGFLEVVPQVGSPGAGLRRAGQNLQTAVQVPSWHLSMLTTNVPPGSQLQGTPGQQGAVPGEPEKAAVHRHIALEQPADGPVGPGGSRGTAVPPSPLSQLWLVSFIHSFD